ncbi:1-phosphatidylinositol phosphodiesterase [Microdochium nivale]|nr:1-phosphatidylinositol phosphodiesterase [Microdochium nivale]
MAFWRAAGLSLLAANALAQTSLDDPRTTQTGSSISLSSKTTPTAAQSFPSGFTLGTGLGQIPDISSSMAAGNTTSSANGTQTNLQTTQTITFLTGTNQVVTTVTGTGNFSLPTTSSSSPTPIVTNTQPCNNYPEFCNRKYSNITEVACHNSPFITPNNVAANQQYDVISQLNDGARLLQAQMQFPSGSSVPHFCHTSCDIYDAGPITEWLSKVATWVATHPYDVVTILLGNGDYSSASKYVPYIEDSGILRYIYTPPKAPMYLEDWPTLGEMILQGKRVVMWMDYVAEQDKYPWLFDEFPQMSETPYDPTNNSFPCNIQRPPDLPEKDVKNRLYMMNHNLNIELSLLGISMPVPARTELNVTNAQEGFGSLGLSVNGCLDMWGRPPNFLNVDYYNYGNKPGSVFEVAARMNNVTYNRPCCGTEVKSAAPSMFTKSAGAIMYVGALLGGVCLIL